MLGLLCCGSRNSIRDTNIVNAAHVPFRNAPIPSLFAVSSLFRLLSPIIPVHPRHSPVSPIIPALTQKQGGGGRYLSGNVPKLSRRADIPGTTCRAPTREGEKQIPRFARDDNGGGGTARWPPEGGPYRGKRNPRTGLPGGGPGRTHRERPATT